MPLYTGNKPPGIEIKKTVLFKIASNSKIPRNKANKGLKYLYCTWKTTRHWWKKLKGKNGKTYHGHGLKEGKVVSAKIRLIIFFAAKDEEALYSQQKQDRELTVAQIMNSYCKIQT